MSRRQRFVQLFVMTSVVSLILVVMYGVAMVNPFSKELERFYKIAMSQNMVTVTLSKLSGGTENSSAISRMELTHSNRKKISHQDDHYMDDAVTSGVRKVSTEESPYAADDELRKRGSRLENDTKTTVLPPIIIGNTQDDAEIDYLEERRTVSGTCAGRIGNRMFKHAALLGLALEFNRTFVHDTHLLSSGFANLTSLPFSLVNESDPSGARTQRMGSSGWGKCAHDTIKYISTHHNITHIIIGGYMQAWCYFDKFRDQVRKEFTFHANLTTSRNYFLIKHARNAFGHGVNASAVTYIGVHIRRGDMMGGSLKGYTVADVPYLQHAVAYMEKKLQSSKYKLYVIASDDKVWPKEHFKAPSPVVFITDTVPDFPKSFYDMAILAGCNHTIMTVGSYGWWSAYLAGGLTVYYKHFPREESNLERGCNRSEYYMPGWVGLE